MLWNSQKTEYRNKAKRQLILETKATELEIGVDHLWTWFKSLRDMFTRQVFMFEIMKMLQIIAMTSIIMEIIYLPYTYILTIYLPYAYNTYQVGQEEEWGGPATVEIDGEGDVDKSQIWLFPRCCQPPLEARPECKY